MGRFYFEDGKYYLGTQIREALVRLGIIKNPSGIAKEIMDSADDEFRETLGEKGRTERLEEKVRAVLSDIPNGAEVILSESGAYYREGNREIRLPIRYYMDSYQCVAE